MDGWLGSGPSFLPFLPFPHAPSSGSPGLRAEWERSLFSTELFCQVLHQWWTLTQWDVETWAWDPQFVPRLIGKHRLGKASSHSSSSSQSNIWGSSQQPNSTSNVGYWLGDPLVGNLPSTLDHSSGSVYKAIFKTACPRIFLGPSWRGLSPGISQRWQWPLDLVKLNSSTHRWPALSCSFCVAVIFQWNLEITEGWLFSVPLVHALPSREKEGKLWHSSDLVNHPRGW